MAKEDIRSCSLEELRAMKERGELYPTSPDSPTYMPPEEFWEEAEFIDPKNQRKVHTGIRFNYEMLEWFKSQGKGWQTHMDKVLCAYYEAHKKQTPTP